MGRDTLMNIDKNKYIFSLHNNDTKIENKAI